MEYKVSCKIEGMFGKTSTVTKLGNQPKGVEKIKQGEPFFLIESDHDHAVCKSLFRNIAAIYLHQKYGPTDDFAKNYQEILNKFSIN